MEDNMRKILMVVAACASVGLAGCQTLDGMGTKQAVGTGGGAILGGLAGAQVGKGRGQLWATGAGALLGALLGSEIGGSLDRADRMYAGEATERAYSAPVGQTIRWDNPQSGNYGTITPVRDGRDNGGRYCREYSQTIYVGGRQQSGYGTACQAPDGSWQVVN
jgi:surface antigen